MISLILTLSMLAWPVCFALGVRYARRMDKFQYKQRWLNAVKTLEEMADTDAVVAENLRLKDGMKVALKKAEELDSKADKLVATSKATKQITKQTNYYRDQNEKARLKAGLPPIDPLTGLTNYYYNQMVKRRLGYGYDEQGTKFK